MSKRGRGKGGRPRKSRKRTLPERFETTIERLAHGGDGVARVVPPGSDASGRGKVVFVADALPAERVEVALDEEHKRFARGRAVRIVEPSPHRRAPDCRHEQAGCGGCGLRHASDERAFDLKLDAAMAEVRKIAREVVLPEPRPHPAATLDGWRHRARLHVHERAIGLFARNTHDVLPIPDCLALAPALLAAVARVQTALSDAPKPSPRTDVTVELQGDDVFVVWDEEPSPALRSALDHLVETGAIAGVRYPEADATGRLRITESVEIAGRSGTLARVPGSFAQASPEANATLRGIVVEWLQRLTPARIIDLYAGSGNLTIAAALACPEAELVAVEVVAEALQGLRDSAELSEFADRLDRVRADLSEGLPESVFRRATPDTALILDPPRSGAGELVGEVLAMPVKHACYVACEPTALARDLGMLATQFDVVALHALDMFPRTPHIELVAILERRDT